MNPLFEDGQLHDLIARQQQRIRIEIEGLSEQHVLNASHSQIAEYFYDQYCLSPIVLNFDTITVDYEETQIDVSQDRTRSISDRTQPLYLKGTRIIFSVPFEGNSDLFLYRPSSFSLSCSFGEIVGNELHIIFEQIDPNPDTVKNNFNHQLQEINQSIQSVNSDVKLFNDKLKPTVENSLNNRKQKLLRDSKLASGLGFPLKRRNDAPKTFSLPMTRKQISLPKPKNGVGAPEPTLETQEYENILEIMSNMAVVLEQSPSAFVGMEEEHLRQHFLVQLNGQYKGQARAEVFNFKGKTDILITEEGRNIFITECKFWKGPAALKETIDQLLGYTCWRDTKTCIVIFNRNKDFTSVLKQIPVVVKEHSNFKKMVDYQNETRFRFVLHHNDDKNRDIMITILAFEVPT